MGRLYIYLYMKYHKKHPHIHVGMPQYHSHWNQPVSVNPTSVRPSPWQFCPMKAPNSAQASREIRGIRWRGTPGVDSRVDRPQITWWPAQNCQILAQSCQSQILMDKKVGESLQNRCKIDAGGLSLSNHLQLSNQKKTFHGFHELCATVKKKNLWIALHRNW